MIGKKSQVPERALILAPHGRTTTVAGIDSTDGPVDTAHAGDSVALRLADEIDLTRGDLLASQTRPADTREFQATVVGLTEKELRAGQAVKLRIGTAFVRARVASVDRVLDLDGNLQPLVSRTDDSEMDVTIGADGFSYTREGQGEESMPEWKQGEYKLGNQL